MIEIIDAAYSLPENNVTSVDLEMTFPQIKPWLIQRLTGVIERRHRKNDEYPSTLAANAGKKLIEKYWKKIDMLLFASTSRDVTEPATWNIVQYMTWLDCHTYDISNACNSFLNWIDVANLYITSWRCKRILLCTWETPTAAINWKSNNINDLILWSTLGDAWAAFLLWNSENQNTWIKYQFFSSKWEFWKDISILWWWVRSPRNPDDTYFKSNLTSSIEYFQEIGLSPFLKGFEVTWWKLKDIDKVFFHQASKEIRKLFMSTSGIPEEKIISTFFHYGNTASASIPLAFALEKEKWNIKEWEKVIFICPAAWLAYWILFIQL